ncbi:MAG TPA: nucleotidyl transferase, partial [Solirubrobacteraceae bacterium]
NGGFFCVDTEVLELLGPETILERDPLARLASAGQLRAYRHEGFWDCMDTYKDAVTLDDLWSTGQAPWKLWP